MPIITIFRGAFSGGPEIAERVAADLGYRSVSREVLVEANKRYGIPEAKFTEVLESEPRWWERWRESLRLYRIALQAAMCEVAQEGNMVYHGHMGHELLPGIRHVVKVLLTAPLEYRVERVRTREGLDEIAARRYIEQVDKSRTRRLEEVFGADWRDPSRYDLVLNIGRMTLETASHLIGSTARREEYQPTASSEQAFQDLAVTARAQAAIITAPKTRNLNIQIRAEQGVVYVSGVLTQPALQEEIVKVVEGVQGATKVIADFESPPIEYMFP
jgi:cytidylate kinase